MRERQQSIIHSLGAQPVIDPAIEISRRVQFLADYALNARVRGFVLGISGGQDSTLAGRLAQMAAERLREAGHSDMTFVAVRLPYATQIDADDAQLALNFIRPDETMTINIARATDVLCADVDDAMGSSSGVAAALRDFVRGNVKARMRMVTQYAIAGQRGLLVVGSDHAAEAITGFYTKFGDGSADVMPLGGLNKRQGAALLQSLGAAARLWEKIPTADLEDGQPGQSDEEALGVSYHDIDDYLEGKEISVQAAERIEELYRSSAHKRALPAAPGM